MIAFAVTSTARLAIAAKTETHTAEAQGGRIWVESTSGGGAVFRFMLPRA